MLTVLCASLFLLMRGTAPLRLEEAGPSYRITDLGVEPDGEAFLNDAGTVAGNLRAADGGSPAFLRTSAGLFRLGNVLRVHGLNGRGALAVTTADGPGVWESGSVRTVPPEGRSGGLVPGGTPIAVDDAGLLYLLGTGVEGVYAVWTWPRTRDLYGSPYPEAVSPDGWIAGARPRGGLQPFPAKGPSAFLYGGPKRSFDHDPGEPIGGEAERVRPKAVARGHAVGGAFAGPNDPEERPFVWKAGRFVPLPLPTGERSTGEALGLNDRGEAVGRASWNVRGPGDSMCGFRHAALWREGRFYDLNDLVPRAPAYELTSALAVNARGQILVESSRVGQPSSRTRLLLLTPNPPGPRTAVGARKLKRAASFGAAHPLEP